jgi:hypothetical protein
MSEILHWEWRTTRKPHRCFGCGKVYPVGSKMIDAAYTDGGRADGCHWCDTCVEYMRRYFESGDETGYGEIYDGDPERWNALKSELESKKPVNPNE